MQVALVEREWRRVMQQLFTRMLVLPLLLAICPYADAKTKVNCECSFSQWNYKRLLLQCARQGPQEKVSCKKELQPYIAPGYEFFPSFGFYRLYRTGKPFSEARKICQRDRGDLGVPESRAEFDRVFLTIMSTHKMSPEAILGIYEKTNVDTQYFTVHGKSFSGLGMDLAEQSLNGTQDCVFLTNSGELKVRACKGTLSNFVCERPLRSPVPSGYRYINSLGFYKAFPQKRNYKQAMEACVRDGAVLATPSSPEEVDALWALLDPLNIQDIYINAHDSEKKGNFVTGTGTPLSELQFLSWKPGEPRKTDQDCVILIAQGTMIGAKCSTQSSFVCKQTL